MENSIKDLQEFNKKLGTEKQCLKYLYKLRWPQGYRCPKCGHNKKWNINEFKYKCKECGLQTTVTAGTLFDHIHNPLSTWFKAVWYITYQDKNVSASKLQRELNLGSCHTAIEMLNKIHWAMISYDEKLQGTVEIDVIFYKGKYILIAVEVNNKKVERIRIGEINSPYSKDKDSYIMNFVEKGSIIITKFWNPKFNEFFKREEKSTDYKYPYANRIFSELTSVAEGYSKGFDNCFLDDYSAMYNATRSKLSFEQVIENAAYMNKIRIKMSPFEVFKKYYKVPNLHYLNRKRTA